MALLGARQVGKTTLARQVAAPSRTPTRFFDLEDPRDLAQLADPMLALAQLKGLVVLDEIQRVPDLFASLRVLADRRPLPARFLVLGSASLELLRQSAESLAGRVAYHELTPFSINEVGSTNLTRLWRRGGFPRSYLARTEADSATWRHNFIATFLERDLPQLGFRFPAATLRRFWTMLAHWHGQVFNASEFGRAFGVADTTIRRYLEALEATFVVRTLRPFHANVSKRQVKAPKIYVADSGLLHALLDIVTQRDLDRHPTVGASWEGFLLENVVHATGARRDQCYYWATHAGAELDLVIVDGSRRRGFEFKRTTTPRMTPSMRIAMHDLKLAHLDVVHAGSSTFQLERRVRAIAADRLLDDL
ncbi:MAG: ATP-binding protein [Gemmatimonadaceae bacterium]